MTAVRSLLSALVLTTALTTVSPVLAVESDGAPPKTGIAEDYFKPDAVTTSGSVTVGGKAIDYTAVAGTLVVHAAGFDDVAPTSAEADKEPPAEASMFYTAYFKKGAKPGSRPVTFFFNGGPGSATLWLHMGAYGPRRIVTTNDSHTPAAPYQIVNNDGSLLDVSDLVFIDAPGAGFSRIAGKDKEKNFYGVDQDAHAFAEFINQFLGKYGRWNSPKYIFGESYGTTRAGALAQILQNDHAIDLNGVIMLSQILNYDFDGDVPQQNPGMDLPYQLLLPTFAATAWYHKRVPGQPAQLEPFLAEVEKFAMTDYALALQAGSTLPKAEFVAIAEKLHAYTGLPVDYIRKADLRINVGAFSKTLQEATGMTTGRLDSRFAGPTVDMLSKEAEYDPQSSAISSAYVAAFNDYARVTLKYGEGRKFKVFADIEEWDFGHRQPGAAYKNPKVNVMVDLGVTMKMNPKLKVLLTGGYYDLATPYFQGRYEMRHLGLPPALQGNISYKYYPSGHMIYANEEVRRNLSADVAAFIRDTDNLSGE